ncbi:hypothetical protein JCM16303_004826 [Sporobolomyces ruberrimus]
MSRLLLHSLRSSTRLTQSTTPFVRSYAMSAAPYTTVSTPNAPSAVGPYSQAIKTDSLIFCSGCVPLVPETMKVIEGGVEEHTEQAMKNLAAVLEGAGSDLSHVVKTTVFLKNMVNAIYSKHFRDAKPARSCVEVARLPLGVLFEIEAIALPKK